MTVKVRGKKTMTQEPFDTKLAVLIKKHSAACEALAAAKAAELGLRKEILNVLACGAILPEGTNTFVCPPNCGHENTDLKVVQPYTYRIDKIELMSVVLPQLPVTLQTDGGLVRWKPELVLSEYRKLHGVHQNLFNTCLTITPGQAQIEYKLKK